MKEKLKPQIRRLNDMDLFRGMCDRDIYPVTSTSSVYSLDKHGDEIEDVEPVLEDRLQAIEEKLAAIKECDCGSIPVEDIEDLFDDLTDDDSASDGTSSGGSGCKCDNIPVKDIEDLFDGSSEEGTEGDTSGYVLPIASETTLGGVKVGDNLSIDSDTGVLSAETSSPSWNRI